MFFRKSYFFNFVLTLEFLLMVKPRDFIQELRHAAKLRRPTLCPSRLTQNQRARRAKRGGHGKAVFER